MPPNTTSEKPINPNEDLSIPKFINEEYFEKILEKDVPNYAKIKSFTPIAATAPGENYTSIMIRVVIELEMKDGSTQQTSYILKTMLDASTGAAFVSSLNLFPKEKQMYQNILPQFEKLYKEAGLDIKLGPDCLHIEESPERITLVMEDLKNQQYGNIDRLKGLDMPHITAVLRRLAEFHAASARYEELNGTYDEIFTTSLFSEVNRPMFEAMGAARQESFLRAMREWNIENVDHYIKKVPEPREYFDEAIRINAVDPDEFNVLNHGDCWANNFMFKTPKNGELPEMRFVDFQIAKWGTPAQDLWYMIVTSASLDIKVEQFDHFIAIYHKRLVECLKILKYSKHIPTLREMHVTMIKYGFWGLMTANGVMVAVLLPSDKDANMENMLKPGPEADEFRYKCFLNPYYAKAQRQLLPFLDNKGILDWPKE